MSIDRSIFVAQPDMTPEAWAAELAGTRIAAESELRTLYNLVSLSPHPDLKRTLSHAFMLALCFTEHRYAADKASIEEKYRTNSWGMRRSLADKEIDGTSIITTPRGQFVKYSNWIASIDDCCFALTDETFVYQQEHRETIRAVIERWSPNGDFDNNAERRMATIAAMMDRLALSAPPSATQGGTMPPKPPMTPKPSPNKGGYATPHKPEALVWHVTVGGAAGSLSWLTNPASNASSNYLIDRTGKIYELVPPTESAWANGAVNQPDVANPVIKGWVGSGVNPNTRTISIECERLTSANEQPGGFTAPQHNALVSLSAWLCASLGIAPDRTHIIRHGQIDSVTRQHCPGLAESEMVAWIGEIAALVNPPAPAPSGMMEPVVTERTDWGGKGRKVSEEITVINDDTGEYFSRKKKYEAAGVVMEDWREV